MAYLQTEKPAPFTFLVSEPEGPFAARDVAIVPVNTSFVPGTVLGAITLGSAATASFAADAGNTGNGVLTLDPTTPVLADAKDGDYRVVFTSSTTFTVEGPAGKEIGKGTVGTAFAKGVKFVIAAGGTAFAAGDAFTVSAGVESLRDQRFVPLNLAASDGSQIVAAIACHGVTADAVVEKKITIFNGPGEVRGSDLIWPAGITAAQKAEGLEQLRRLGIKTR